LSAFSDTQSWQVIRRNMGSVILAVDQLDNCTFTNINKAHGCSVAVKIKVL